MPACLCCEKDCWGLGKFKDAFDVELLYIGFMHTYIRNNLQHCMDLLLPVLSYCSIVLSTTY